MAAKGQTLKEFGELYPAEKKLLEACRNGTVAQISATRPEKLTPGNWVRAEFVRFLARGGDGDSPVHEMGVQLRGAVVVGTLDLAGVRVPYPLRLRDCWFQTQDGQNASLILTRVSLTAGLFLTGSQVKSIYGDGLHTGGDLYLDSGFCASGAIRLLDAQIEGSLSCENGYFGCAEVNSLSFDRANITGGVFLDGGFSATSQVRFPSARIGGDLVCRKGIFKSINDISLFFDQTRIAGTVFLDNGFEAKGEVRFRGANIGGNLECDGGCFSSTEESALSFDGAKISGDVYLRQHFKAMGQVRFIGAEVGRTLDCRNGEFRSKTGRAVILESTKIGGSAFLRSGFCAEGDVLLGSAEIGAWLDLSDGTITGMLDAEHVIVQHGFKLTSMRQKLSGANLRHMQCGSLHDDKTSWGKGNHLNGFTYRSLAHEAPTEPKFRRDWLKDQSPDSGSYRPQPWRHLQKTLKAMGHDAEAREIGIAHEKFRYALGKVGELPPEPKFYDKLSAPLTRGLHQIYGALAGYGYKPLKLVLFSVGIWFFCSWVYWFSALAGYLGPTNPIVFQNPKYGYKEKNCIYERQEFCVSVPLDNWYWLPSLPAEYSTFSPMAYSLDLILPLVDLGQEKDWGVLVPTPKKVPVEEILHFSWGHILRLIVWFEILWGWVASLMLVAVISGLVRNTRDDE
jgi:hypothetical protein